jgi:hypothetical protein
MRYVKGRKEREEVWGRKDLYMLGPGLLTSVRP